MIMENVMKKNVLIIDDEKNICISLSFALEDEYEVFWTLEPEQGYELLNSKPIDIVLLDLKLGPYDGIQILKEIKSRYPELPVIIMTGFGSIESSVEAIKAGAYHYISKPLVMDELKNLMTKALEHAGLSRQVAVLNQLIKTQNGDYQIIGKSPAMQQLFNIIDKIKNINSTILILGESGTGKDLVARAIHYSSYRQKEHYEAVNCPSIPVNLLESEFFGHKKGAFTGADSDRKGKFELCHKGTLFLDEIGDMDLTIQAKLLRALQEKVITPVGSNKEIKVDVRLIAATNKDLKELVANGRFREDLYYRLNVITIEVPPLRERLEDIPLLIQHFIQKYNKQFNKNVSAVQREVIQQLESYDFPGNVRELENMIERAIALADGEMITLADLPDHIRRKSASFIGNDSNIDAATRLPEIYKVLAGKPLAEIEKEAIMVTLEMTNYNRKKAAALLRISERTLRNKLQLYSAWEIKYDDQ